MPNEAIGFSLEIPKEVFNKIKEVDKGIRDLESHAKKSASSINKAFDSIGNKGLTRLINQMTELQKAMPTFDASKMNGLTSYAKKVEKSFSKTAESMVEVSVAMNKLGDNKGGGFLEGVDRWRQIQKEVDALIEKQTQLNKTIKEYDTQISNIKSGKGGVVSKDMREQADLARVEFENNKELIQSYRQKQQAIVDVYHAFKQEDNQVASLKKHLDEMSSIDNMRKDKGLKELNAYYKELEKVSQKEEERQRKKAQRKVDDIDKQNANALKLYDRAMIASEGTIVQRTNKIVKLREAERKLLETGKDYTAQIDKIKQEISRLNKENDKAQKSTQKLTQEHGRLHNVVMQLKNAFFLLFSVSQIKGYVQSLIDVTGEFEKQNKALRAILQNKDEADRLFGQVKELAVRSPFQLKELVTYTKQLAAYRVESDKLYDTTKMLADVSAGLGVDMSRLILAYGQVKAANYLRGTELRQFSEAGINILGELSKMFSEMEGKAVSIGEVFDRVSKRMVTFEDVAEVFKRITSEGGIFYNMQEIQAETIAGMKSNLQDSIDIMKNEIGKDNEELIKKSLTLVRKLVENWHEVAWYAKRFGIALAISFAPSILSSIGKAAQNLFNAAKGAHAFGKALGTLGIGMGVGTVLTALGYISAKLLEMARKAHEADRALQRLKDSLDETFNEDRSNMQRTLKGYRTLVERLGEVNKGSGTHRDIIKQLNSQYGEYLGFIVDETTTYEALKGSIDAVNQSIIKKAQLASYEKGLQLVYSETNKIVSESRKTLSKISEESWSILSNGQERGISQEELDSFFDYYEKRVAEAKDENINFFEVAQEFFKNFNAGGYNKGESDAINAYQKALLTNKKQEVVLQDRINNAYGQTISSIETIKKLNDAETAHKYRLQTIEDFSQSNFERLKAIKQANLEYKLERIKILEEDGALTKEAAQKQRDDLLYWADNTISDINKQVEKNLKGKGYSEEFYSKFRLNESDQEAGLTAIEEKVTGAYQAQVDTIEQLNRVKGAKNRINEDILQRAKDQKVAWKAVADALGLVLDKDDKHKKGTKDKRLEQLQLQLSLIKEMARQYESLTKVADETWSTNEMRKAYADTAKALSNSLLDMGNLVATMSFDTSGINDAFNTILESISKNGSEEMKLAVKQAMDDVEVQVNIDPKIKGRERLESDIHDLFDALDLYKEADKLGFDKNLAKSVFGIEAFTLDDLEKLLIQRKQEFTEYGEEGLKLYLSSLAKVSELKKKERTNDLKEFSKYLIEAQDKRVKIEKDAREKIEKIRNLKGLTDDQKSQAEKNITKEMERDLASFDWEELKGLDLYRQSFEDLARVGETTLESLIEKLEEFARTQGQALDVTSFRELMRNLKNARNELESRKPFEYFKEGWDEYRNATKYKKVAKTKEGKSAAENKQREGIDKMQDSLKRLSKSYSDVTNAMSDMVNITFELAEGLGFVMDENDKQVLDSFAKGFNLVGQAMSSILPIIVTLTTAGIDLQDAFLPLLAIGAVLGGLFAIIKAHDNNQQKKIEEEQKRIERLQKSYEALQEAMENAFSAEDKYTKKRQSELNLREQIASRYRELAAEEAKKGNGKEEERKRIQDEIDALKEEQKQLETNFVNQLGGFGSKSNIADAAQEFADAWLDAYRETGDGLDALTEKWEEYIKGVVAKQLMLKGTEKFLAEPMKMFDAMLANDGKVSTEEMQRFREVLAEKLPQLNEFWKSIADSLGIIPESEKSGGTMSELQKGIQNITETTAQALEALLNSMRFFVADSNAKLNSLVLSLLSTEEGANPILTELRSHTRLLTSIDRRFASVIKGGHPMGGDGIKSFI